MKKPRWTALSASCEGDGIREFAGIGRGMPIALYSAVIDGGGPERWALELAEPSCAVSAATQTCWPSRAD